MKGHDRLTTDGPLGFLAVPPAVGRKREEHNMSNNTEISTKTISWEKFEPSPKIPDGGYRMRGENDRFVIVQKAKSGGWQVSLRDSTTVLRTQRQQTLKVAKEIGEVMLKGSSTEVAVPEAAPVAEAVWSKEEAERFTQRIKLIAVSVRESIINLAELIDEAKAKKVHVTLGYPSWTAYLADVLGEEPLHLPADRRQEVVQFLSGEGMSTRAIAPVVGVSQRTVVKDIQVSTKDSPEPEVKAGRAPMPSSKIAAIRSHYEEATADESEAKPVTKPKTVTGRDGKTYSRKAKTVTETETKPVAQPKSVPINAFIHQLSAYVEDTVKSIGLTKDFCMNDKRWETADQGLAESINDLRDRLVASQEELQGAVNVLNTWLEYDV